MIQATLGVVLSKGYHSILLTTAPPMDGLVGIVAGALRGVPFDYWLMDLNLDQAVELGHARAGSAQVRVFDALNRAIPRRARNVITLDEAMAQRCHAKCTRAPLPKIVPV